MRLDLSKFKKISEDQHAAMLRHPDGHHIKVAKKPLSKKMQEELSKLPLHLAKGTEDGPIGYSSLGAEEEKRRAQEGHQIQFPEVKNSDQAPVVNIFNGPQPQQIGPTNDPQEVYDYNYQRELQSRRNQNYSHLEDPMLQKQAEEAVINRMAAEKQQREAAALEREKAATMNQRMMAENQQSNFQKSAADIQAQNAKRQAIGLPPLEAPQAPQGMMAPQQPAIPAQPQMPQAPMQPEMPVPQQPQDPYGTQAYYDAYTQGLGAQKEGIQEAAQAEGQIAKEQVGLMEPAIEQMQQRAKAYDEHYAELDRERKAFQQDLINQHIDPMKHWNEKSVGSKVSTAIGLILGGMGGGLMHTENPALKFLNQQIDRDIESQKSELGKKENLLTANYRQFGNLHDAVQMTQIMQSDILKNQIALAAAKSNNPLVQARAKQAIGQLDMQAAPILAQMAMRKSMLGSLSTGQIDPSMVIRMIVPEGQQGTAYKELGEAQALTRFRDNVLGAFDKINQINTLGNRATSPIQTKRQVDAIRSVVLSELSKELAGKFTEFEMENLKSSLPEVLDNEKTVQTKLANLNKILGQKMNFPILRAYGINVGNVGVDSRYGSGGGKKIQMGAPVPVK